MDETLNKIIEEISKRPLRSSVLTSSVLVENMLEKILKKHFISEARTDELFSHQGCLGTFSSKIEIAYAMGIISKELHDDMNTYRKIRNQCAHNILMDEPTLASIQSLVGNFILLKKVFVMGKHEDTLVYTCMEFAIIFICLIKRLNNIETLSPYPIEAHDDYLVFNEKDFEFLSNFGTIIKSKR